MNAEDVRDSLKGFLALVTSPAPRSLEELIAALDRLASSVHSARGHSPGENDADPPLSDPERRRRQVQAAFPELGLYSQAADPLVPSSTELVVGDAVDDVADISLDIEEALWLWEHESESEALWSLCFLFDSHWGLHLRSLQLYLHARRQ